MLHMQDIIYTHMSDTLYGTLDQHLKQPVLAWQSLQKPLTDHRRLSVLCQQKVCPVLYQKFLLGMDKSFQQEWRPCGSNQLTSYTSNWLICHLKVEWSEVVKKMSKSYQKLSKNVLGGNCKARNTVTLHLSQKLSAKWQRPIHTHTSTLHPTHTHTSDAFIPFPPPLPRPPPSFSRVLPTRNSSALFWSGVYLTKGFFIGSHQRQCCLPFIITVHWIKK